jgi:ribosomal protein L11 methyltransferase
VAAAGTHWFELTVGATADTSEALTNLLWELGALGVVEEETATAPPRLRAFFPETARPDTLEASVASYLADLTARGFATAGAPRVSPVEDPGWAEAWREHFRPVPVGRRLVVVPPWDVVSPDGRIPIVIDPGRAFGTGHHGTTAGCLVALETLVEREAPARALDLGTGSGVLAIAAAKLGVAEILAVDEDPDAIAAAAGNAERNGVADRIRCVVANADAPAAAAPLVLANLLSAAHHRLAAHYPTLVAPRGALVLGGVLDAEADAVAFAVGRAGFLPAERLPFDGWTTLVMRAPARDSDAPVHVRG